MHSLTSLLHAWLRIGAIPALVFWLSCWVRPPVLGWQRQQLVPLLAAWFAVAIVPISGVERLGEFDVVVLAVAVWIALGDGISARHSTLLLGGWVAVVVLLLQTCDTLVLTRMPGCRIDSGAVRFGVVLTQVVLILLVAFWPRQTIPQRMTMIALLALAVEYGRQLIVLWN
jgi:hypothetical protein